MSVTERERLAPSTFRLPVEKIRDGYYSDAYFNHTKALLEADGHHPHVVMQVFQREESILGGVDEAIAVLKQGAGRRGAGRALGRRLQGARGARAARGRRALAVGDGDDDRGRLLAVRPPRDGLPRLHGAPHAGDAQRAPRWSRPRSGKPILFFPARHDHWLVQTGDGWAAHVAGAIGVSTDAQASWWGGRGVGTVPHGLIAAYGGDTVRAARKFAERFAREMNVTVLVDFAQRLGRRPRSRSPRRSAATCGACGWTPPTSSPTWRCSALHGDDAPKGVAPELVTLTREQLDEHGFRDVKIVVSGGFTAERITRLRGRGRARSTPTASARACCAAPTTSRPTS